MRSVRFAAALLGAFAAFALPTAADVHFFNVPMTGAQEVPPVATAGTANCLVTLNDVTGAVTVSGNFSGLTSNATLAHIHGPAPAGMNAGILVTLTENGGTSGDVTGSGTLSAANVTNLLNGLLYLNIHTNNFPNGELRGQITQSIPGMPWRWVAVLGVLALGGGAFVLSRRRAAVSPV